MLAATCTPSTTKCLERPPTSLVASSIWSTNADTAVGDPSTIMPLPDVKISTGPSDSLAPSSLLRLLPPRHVTRVRDRCERPGRTEPSTHGWFPRSGTLLTPPSDQHRRTHRPGEGHLAEQIQHYLTRRSVHNLSRLSQTKVTYVPFGRGEVGRENVVRRRRSGASFGATPEPLRVDTGDHVAQRRRRCSYSLALGERERLLPRHGQRRVCASRDPARSRRFHPRSCP